MAENRRYERSSADERPGACRFRQALGTLAAAFIGLVRQALGTLAAALIGRVRQARSLAAFIGRGRLSAWLLRSLGVFAVFAAFATPARARSPSARRSALGCRDR